MADEDDGPSLLLSGSPDSSGDTNTFLFGALLAGGIGLLMYNKKKKKEEKEGKDSSKKEETKGLPEAKSNQVVFSKDFSEYEIGDSWFSTSLDPYLEDMVENATLATPEWKTKGPLGWVVNDENIETMMSQTRKKVLDAFYISHFVSVGDSQKTIATLPNTQAVQHFKGLIDTHTRKFQEEY